MKLKTLLLPLAVGAFFVINYATGVKEAVKKFAYKINLLKSKIDISKTAQSGFKKVYLNINLDLTNKENVKIDINKISLDLFYTNIKILNYTSSNSFTINSSSTTTINLPIIFEVDQIPSAVKSAFKNLLSTRKLDLNLKGSVTSNFGFSLPINETINVI